MNDAETRKRARDVFAHGLELVAAGRIREWVDLFAGDGVLEFPFPPPGFPARIEGAEALYEHMKDFPEQLQVSFSAPVYHDAADPELVIAEFTSEGTALATGRAFRQSYLSLVWVSGGRITRFRDYWNPWVIIEALGGPAALAQAMDR